MKLYHATTVYQFLNVIAHVQKSNSFGEDVLIFAPWLKEKFNNYKLLKKFFKKVYFYDAAIYRVPEDQLEDAINENINKFLKKNSINLKKFDEIIVGGAQYNFGIYLCNNKIEFSAIEESCGIFSRPEIVENIDSKNPFNTERVAIAKKLEIYQAENDMITKVYCDKDSQKEGFSSDKISDFKVLEILKTMDSDKLTSLLKMFGITEKIAVDESAAFLLTQQFSSLKLMDLQHHILIYQLFCDFFLEGRDIVIKPHPDDVCYYSQFIKNAKVIRKKFPSELTPFVFETLPKTVAAISSTGTAPLKPLFENIIELDFRYEKEFENTIKYYVALQSVSALGLKKCKLFGVDEILFRQLARANDASLEIDNVSEISSLEYSSDTAVIVDLCDHGEKDICKLMDMNFAAYIFLNTDGSFGFYRYECKDIFDNILPIIIKKRITRQEENYLNKNDEVIYAYSADKEIYNKMKDMQIEKELENTGASFNIDNLTKEQLEIERLKGILAATEKRLLYYLNKEKENEDN